MGSQNDVKVKQQLNEIREENQDNSQFSNLNEPDNGFFDTPALNLHMMKSESHKNNKYQRMSSIKSPYYNQPITVNTAAKSLVLRRQETNPQIINYLNRKENLVRVADHITFDDDNSEAQTMVKAEKY